MAVVQNEVVVQAADPKSFRKKKKKKKTGKPEKFKRREWAGRIKDIQFTNISEETWSPFFHFTLGGLFVEVDNRASGGDWVMACR
jgi:hypothetical protein